MRTLGDGNIVISQQGAFGLFQGHDRDVVRGLVLSFRGDGRRVLADCVEEAVDGDTAFLIIRSLGVEPLRAAALNLEAVLNCL